MSLTKRIRAFRTWRNDLNEFISEKDFDYLASEFRKIDCFAAEIARGEPSKSRIVDVDKTSCIQFQYFGDIKPRLVYSYKDEASEDDTDLPSFGVDVEIAVASKKSIKITARAERGLVKVTIHSSGYDFEGLNQVDFDDDDFQGKLIDVTIDIPDTARYNPEKSPPSEYTINIVATPQFERVFSGQPCSKAIVAAAGVRRDVIADLRECLGVLGMYFDGENVKIRMNQVFHEIYAKFYKQGIRGTKRERVGDRSDRSEGDERHVAKERKTDRSDVSV